MTLSPPAELLCQLLRLAALRGRSDLRVVARHTVEFVPAGAVVEQWASGALVELRVVPWRLARGMVDATADVDALGDVPLVRCVRAPLDGLDQILVAFDLAAIEGDPAQEDAIEARVVALFAALDPPLAMLPPAPKNTPEGALYALTRISQVTDDPTFDWEDEAMADIVETEAALRPRSRGDGGSFYLDPEEADAIADVLDVEACDVTAVIDVVRQLCGIDVHVEGSTGCFVTDELLVRASSFGDGVITCDTWPRLGPRPPAMPADLLDRAVGGDRDALAVLADQLAEGGDRRGVDLLDAGAASRGTDGEGPAARSAWLGDLARLVGGGEFAIDEGGGIELVARPHGVLDAQLWPAIATEPQWRAVRRLWLTPSVPVALAALIVQSAPVHNLQTLVLEHEGALRRLPDAACASSLEVYAGWGVMSAPLGHAVTGGAFPRLRASATPPARGHGETVRHVGDLGEGTRRVPVFSVDGDDTASLIVLRRVAALPPAYDAEL